MDISISDVIAFVVENKFWFIVAIPVVVAIMVLKIRG